MSPSEIAEFIKSPEFLKEQVIRRRFTLAGKQVRIQGESNKLTRGVGTGGGLNAPCRARIPCPICGVEFTKVCMTRHVRAHSNVKREVSHFPSHQLIPCPTCGAVYEAYYMKRHLKTHIK
jgi:hypothetical protein